MKNDIKKEQNWLFFLQFDVDSVFFCIFISYCLDNSDFGILPGWFEQVTETFLGLEIFINWFTDDLFCFYNLAVDHFKIDPEARLYRQFCNCDRLVSLKTPAGAAGCMKLDIAGTFGVDRLLNLLHEISGIGN